MAAARIPLIVFGDGPRLSSGLARIARDLTTRLWAESDSLGIHVAQVGVDDPSGWHFSGGWDFYGFQPTKADYGRSAMYEVVLELREAHGVEPVVFCITDPARVYDLIRPPLKPKDPPLDTTRIWGYFPIDAENPHGKIGGPAALVVQACERVIAYGRYGAEVLKRTLDNAQQPVSYLPHGIETQLFAPTLPQEGLNDEDFWTWEGRLPSQTCLIGCVATNQPRKDLGLLFLSVARVKTLLAPRPVALWLHTDLLTHAWDIGELARVCGFTPQEVFVSTETISDTALAARYTASAVTVAPGLGEGFGYPIVESLSCGTPVIHGKYAGGVELIPREDWLVSPVAWRLESVYALSRPVFNPVDVAQVVVKCVSDLPSQQLHAYCRGTVAHLDWEFLWPRWRSWFRKGLQSERVTQGERPQPDQHHTDPDAPVPPV